MKNQQPLISIAGLVSLLLITTSTAMARSTPVTVQNDASNPVSVEVVNNSGGESPGTLYELVGVSSEAVDARSGALKLNNACDADFPGSRMCTTVEIVNSRGTLPTSSGLSWVNPVLEPTQLLNLGNGDIRQVISEKIIGFIKLSNFTNRSTINCQGFSFANSFQQGVVVYPPNGEFIIGQDCAIERTVACCGPVANQ